MGRAAIRGGQGLARLERLQAQGVGESEHRSAVDRLGAEPQAATSVQIQRAEETGTGGLALRQPAPKPYEFRGLRRHRKRHSRRQEGFFNSLTD